MNASGSEITLRPLAASDIPMAMELKNLAGWNQTARDWSGYLEYEPDGCFVAEHRGRAVGTATTIRYGERFGWIGMVLVHPECRRLGIGTVLLRAAIEYLQRTGTGCVKLDATPMGRSVYVPMGFQDEYALSRYEGTVAGGAGGIAAGVKAMSGSDLPDMNAFDAPIFGAERPAVLRSMNARNPEYCFVWRDGRGALRGYLIAREGLNAVQLGPWIATEPGVASDLLQAFFANAAGKRVYLDVPHPNAAGIQLITSVGFTVQRGYVRMFLGENRHPGIPGFVFGTSSAEKG